MTDGSQRGFAALFPGQLSEGPGMGESLYREFGFVRDFFAEIERRSGVSIPEVYFGEGAPSLHDSRPAQVGVFAVSLAVYDVLNLEFDLLPDAVAGYSLGTYAAFVAAGILDRWDALEVILEVERLLVEEGPPGAMGYVIGMTRSSLEELICRVEPDSTKLSIGNQNAPSQFVLTGTPEAVFSAISEAKKVALAADLLPMNAPMHSRLLAPLTSRVRSFVQKIEVRRPQSVALFAPMFGRRIESEHEAADVLANQIGQPSHWEPAMRALWDEGFHRYAELGPGHVLSKMLRWSLRQARVQALDEPVVIEKFALGRFTMLAGMTGNAVAGESA